MKGVFAFFERECCRCIFHGLAVGACLSEVFLLAVAHEDCLAVASEALWPEVTKVCDFRSEWKMKLASGLLAEVEPDSEHKSSFWFLKLEELLEMT